jgi:hypothetical protein
MRKNKKPAAFKALSFGVIGFSAVHSANAETTITFGSFTLDNQAIPAGYGNNVSANSADYTVSAGATGITGTPNIVANWSANIQTYTAWDGRGEVGQLDFNGAAANQITLTLTPDPGFSVLVRSFDLDYYAGGDPLNLTWSISDPVGTLATGLWTQDAAGGRDPIDTGLTLGDTRLGQPVTITFTMNSGSPSYIALDNLSFDQVPEPSTTALALTGLGLGALAMRRRRRR